MPVRPLPNDPSLEHLRKEAKRLRLAVRAGDGGALAKVREFHPRAASAIESFALADAQLVTARAYGFASWAKLRQHLAAIAPVFWNPPRRPDGSARADAFIWLACLTYAGWHRSNPDKARRMLDDEPELAGANLYTAVAAGDVALVRSLIDRDPGLVNARGGPLDWPTLLYACYSRLPPSDGGSSLEVARELLRRGADPNAGFLYSGSYAFTALTGAFGRGEDWPNQPPHPECEALATLLLEAGADPNDAQTLYNRHFQPNDDHLRLLLRYGLGQDRGGPWLKRLNDRRVTPKQLLADELWSAAKNHFMARLKLLLDHGAPINTPSLRNGRTPYEEALRAGSPEIAEYLAARGAARIELDPSETFALACIAGRRDEVRSRLADEPGLLDRIGRRGLIELLHRAVEAESIDGVLLLLELGADINGMIPGTGYDRAVLHNAAGFGDLAWVERLIALGADPALRDLAFHSAPVGWAFHNQQRDIVRYLLAFASIFDAVRCDGVERVAALLDADPALAQARDESGTPLVFYLHPQLERLEEMAHLLAGRGGDFNARDRTGRTVLDSAIARGLNDFADVLRRHGAQATERS